MGSAVDNLVNGYETEQPVNFYDYYNAYGKDHAHGKWTNADPNSIGGKLENWLFGTGTSAKQAYENYLSEYEYRRNLAAKQAENAWTASREDSQVQRAMKDIQAAGLNPWLALNGGSMSSAMVASQSASARYKAKEQQLKQDKKSTSLLASAVRILIMYAMMG